MSARGIRNRKTISSSATKRMPGRKTAEDDRGFIVAKFDGGEP